MKPCEFKIRSCNTIPVAQNVASKPVTKTEIFDTKFLVVDAIRTVQIARITPILLLAELKEIRSVIKEIDSSRKLDIT
jgi:hypothetical protein